jgi:hypothetical protein
MAAGSWRSGAYPHASYAGTTVARGALFGLAFLSPLGTAVAVGCVALASFLGPFGWVGSAAMHSTETPAGQATTMVLAVSIYSLGAPAGGAALGLVLPLAAAAVVPVWRRGRRAGAVP